jgi:hypothetical protein
VRAAIQSGVPEISKFDQFSAKDKAVLIAHYRTVEMMEAWEAQRRADLIEDGK